MFLRANKRFKDGKEHRYWSIVESYRAADDRILQRPVLYLGEINDSQHAAWCRAIDVLHEGRAAVEPLALFPDDRPAPCSGVATVCPAGLCLEEGICSGSAAGSPQAGLRHALARLASRCCLGVTLEENRPDVDDVSQIA